MAFPNCYKYFLATQLVTEAWWLHPDLFNTSTSLEAAVVGTLEAPQFLVYRGPRAPYDLTPSMLTTLLAWRAGLQCESYKKIAISPNAPIWLNPNLAQIHRISDTYAWTKHSLKIIAQIVSHKSLILLYQLSTVYNILNYYHFRYMKLFHAFAA